MEDKMEDKVGIKLYYNDWRSFLLTWGWRRVDPKMKGYSGLHWVSPSKRKGSILRIKNIKEAFSQACIDLEMGKYEEIYK